jgi:quercetin dioxygenase-like cupin family protein
MKIIKCEDLCNIVNPSPGQAYRPEIKLDEERFAHIGGMFGLLVPGSQVPYHYHKDRESIVIPLSGEAVEIVEGKETVVRPGDILLIPSGEKHATANRSDCDFRYVEFFTSPPLGADFIKAD